MIRKIEVDMCHVSLSIQSKMFLWSHAFLSDFWKTEIVTLGLT